MVVFFLCHRTVNLPIKFQHLCWLVFARIIVGWALFLLFRGWWCMTLLASRGRLHLWLEIERMTWALGVAVLVLDLDWDLDLFHILLLALSKQLALNLLVVDTYWRSWHIMRRVLAADRFTCELCCRVLLQTHTWTFRPVVHIHCRCWDIQLGTLSIGCQIMFTFFRVWNVDRAILMLSV